MNPEGDVGREISSGGGSAHGATWTVLGAGSALPRPGYGPAGYALRPAPGAPVTLFDCGPGNIRSLASAGIGVAEIERVVISHFHADHFLDVFALAFARHNPALAASPGLPELELIGPRGLARRLDEVARALGASVAFPEARVVEVEVHATPTRLEPERGGLRLASVGTRHTDTSLAWRVELESGLSATYTGDTCEVPEVARLATGTDLFVVECCFPDGAGSPNHLTPTSAARLAREAGAGTLLLTHFYPGLDPEQARSTAARVFPGPIELAWDGRCLSLDALPGAPPGAPPGP